ncbi:MAG TPA: toll/interleukin-1 receptor domain-containing protein [Haliangium sp.]|nr:toll/interleukin-1 receptor domain-containing protein [Haliangium sp.]
MTQAFDVFVSHSSVDKPWVRALSGDLARYGVSVWVDEEQIRPGAAIVDALEQALEVCRAVALVVAPESMASGWVREEYHRAVALALRKDRPLQLIPVLLRAAELPGFLASRSWVDFRDATSYATSVWRLVWGITGTKPPAVLDLHGAPAAVVAPAAPAAAAAAPAAAPGARAPSREAALARLLTDAFDGNNGGLQQWIRLSLGQDVYNSVALNSSLSQLAFDTVLAVQQRGLADRALFESLLAQRPGRREQIRDVARLYGIALAP